MVESGLQIESPKTMNDNKRECCHLDLQGSTHRTTGKWVSLHPTTSHIFQSLGNNVCLGGFKSLRKDCTETNLDYEDTVEKLNASINKHRKTRLAVPFKALAL